MYVNVPNILAALLFAISAGLAFITPDSLIVTAITVGFLAFRVKQARRNYPLRIQAALENLNAVMNEIAEFRRYFEEERRKKDEIFTVVEFL